MEILHNRVTEITTSGIGALRTPGAVEALYNSARGISPWIAAPVAFALWVIILTLLKRLLYSRIRAFAVRTTSPMDDVLVNAIALPSGIIIFASGIVVSASMLPLSPQADNAFKIAFGVATLVAAVLFFDRLVRELIRCYSPRVEFLNTSKGILVGVTRAIIIGTALIILLDSLGVSITPLLASLGIGSLAVALALQDTLANFFAGVQVLADKPVVLGNFVKLETGEEGYVAKVGWRSTQIKMLSNNIIIVPNSKLINSIITNYSFPEQELSVLVQVGVHYKSDLERVEKVICEVGKEVMQTVKGGLPEFEPFIRYHTFGDSSIDLTVILRAREFVDNYFIKHEFIKRLHERFNKEGIVIPFPIRTLEIDREDLDLLAGGEGKERAGH